MAVAEMVMTIIIARIIIFFIIKSPIIKVKLLVFFSLQRSELLAGQTREFSYYRRGFFLFLNREILMILGEAHRKCIIPYFPRR